MLIKTTSAALLAAALGALAAMPVSAAASVGAVALHKSDVPKGFSLKSQVLNNTQMAKASGVSKAQLDQHGRITGVDETFSTGKRTGFIEVVSNVYQYKTAAGAFWDYQQSTAHDRTRGRKTSPAPKIGDNSTGFVLSAKSGNYTYIAYSIDFQRGAYDMVAAVIGVRGSVSMNNAARFARIMANRAH